MRDKRTSVKSIARFRPNYSYVEKELNCELYVEKEGVFPLPLGSAF